MEENSFLFTYDLKGAYHHISIFSEHRRYLGFSFTENGDNAYYVFNSLPFGIRTAGHIFTKILRVVVAFLRAKGKKVVMFLDDGIGGHSDYTVAVQNRDCVKQTMRDFGFLLADEKCNWIPSRRVTWLGHLIDMERNMLFISGEELKGYRKLLTQFCIKSEILNTE